MNNTNIIPTYIIKIDHRNNSPRKSQWCISQVEENKCFQIMFESNWYQDFGGWGLYIDNGVINYLGVGVSNSIQLFIAKFIDSNKNGIWHGYPANYIANQQDTPSLEILLDWTEKKYINMAKLRKINKNQPCRI